jgi:hypothetical protein
MIVRLKRRNARYRDLSTRQPYVVIGIEADDLRMLNDAGRPCLYPSRLFAVVDRGEPTDWVSEFGTDGERYANPPLLNKPGFFEDFFDDKPKAVATFWRVINHRLSSEGTSTAVISNAQRPSPSRCRP